MDLGPLRALAADLTQQILGVPVTVTRPLPDVTPVVTTGIWTTTPLEESRPFGVDFQRSDPRRVLALPRRTLASVPRGTEIAAPETPDGAVLTWIVDGLDKIDGDTVRVIVVPSTS